MRFPVYFKRRIGGSGSIPTVGSDTAPTFATTALKNLDNILSHRLQRPMKRVSIGYWYEGVGSIVTLPVSIYLFDESSAKWYLASTGTLTNGQMTYLRCASLADPPQVQANLGQPGHGIDVMIVVSNNSGGDGTYHFIAGPDTSEF